MAIYHDEPACRAALIDVQAHFKNGTCVLVHRQPPSERLFPSASGFEAVSEAVLGGVSSSCLRVTTHAASAASALFR